MEVCGIDSQRSCVIVVTPVTESDEYLLNRLFHILDTVCNVFSMSAKGEDADAQRESFVQQCA